jgi:hypothetical protein
VIHFTEPLPGNDRRDIHTGTQTDGRDLYAVEMDSGAMIYIPIFIKIVSGIQKLMWGGGGGYTDTQRACR